MDVQVVHIAIIVNKHYNDSYGGEKSENREEYIIGIYIKFKLFNF